MAPLPLNVGTPQGSLLRPHFLYFVVHLIHSHDFSYELHFIDSREPDFTSNAPGPVL